MLLAFKHQLWNWVFTACKIILQSMNFFYIYIKETNVLIIASGCNIFFSFKKTPYTGAEQVDKEQAL